MQNISLSIQSKPNYELIGWTEEKGGKDVINNLKEVKIDDNQPDLMLYAVYKPKTVRCKIHFEDVADGDTRLDPSYLDIDKKITYNGKEYVVKIPDEQLKGNRSYDGRRYVTDLGQQYFAGWTTNRNSVTVGGWDYLKKGLFGGRVNMPKVEYNAGDEIEINSDTELTLYAVWYPVDLKRDGSFVKKGESKQEKAEKKSD